MSGEADKTSPAKKESGDKDVVTAAVNHLMQGKRHLLVQDWVNAVESLQQACGLYVQVYGELGVECAEVHHLYGKALLQQARVETGVLGGAIDEAEENKDDSDSENAEEAAVPEAQGDDGGQKEEEAEEEPEEVAAVEKKEDEEKDDDEEEEGGEKEEKEEEKPPAEETPQEGEEEDEHDGGSISTIQLAWEVLETAKLIYTKHLGDHPELKPKLMDTLALLGEVSMESDDYPQAISDLSSCLELQQAELPEDSRETAQTHYQLGMAYSFNNNFKQAVESFKKCLATLQLRLSKLQALVDAGQGNVARSQDAFNTPQRELEEITTLLPEIKAKIEDEESTLANLPAASRKLLEQYDQSLQDGASPSTSAGPSACLSPSKNKPLFLVSLEEDSPKPQKIEVKRPINDISSLVKRKRNSDQNLEVPPVKKAKCEDLSSSSSKEREAPVPVEAAT